VIRPFDLRDIFLVRRLQHAGTQLDLEGAIVRPQSPLRAALASHLPFDGIGATTYVLNGRQDGTRLRGFAQARGRPNGHEADVIYLAPSLAGDDAAPEAWERLLVYLCQAEGAHGVQRLFVKLVEDDNDAIEVFRRVGFVIYTQERLFRLDTLPARDTRLDEIPLRPHQPVDTWGLQRLYCRAAPRLVQQTECVSGDSWEAMPIGRLAGQRDERYVWERYGEIVGYVRLVEGQRGHWLKLLLHHDVQDQADDLVGWSQVLLNDFPPRPVYCSVRGYDTPLQVALKRVGFRPGVSLILLVKHTATHVREPEWRWVPALERGVEPVVSTHSPAASSQ
jgi:hypothetical protein